MGKRRISLQNIVASTLWLLTAPSASAIVGNAPAASDTRSAVMIVGSAGNFCTGARIARDLVLTAAHCVQAGAEYKLVEFDAARKPTMLDVETVVRHPQFDIKALLGHRATADIALLKLKQPLPASIATASVAALARTPVPGDTFVIYGFGVTARGDGRTSGTLRSASLVATGKPGNLQIRLHDPDTRNESPGLGACTGDSGGPVVAGGRIVGVVSWSTGANNTAGCGGLTGVTPLNLYLPWIIERSKALNSPLRQ